MDNCRSAAVEGNNAWVTHRAVPLKVVTVQIQDLAHGLARLHLAAAVLIIIFTILLLAAVMGVTPGRTCARGSAAFVGQERLCSSTKRNTWWAFFAARSPS